MKVQQLGGVRIIESIYLVDRSIDASACRSPSRALRRWHERGIIGRLRLVSTPKPDAYQLQDGTLVLHPETARALREKLAADIDARLFNAIAGDAAPPWRGAHDV